MTPKLSRISWTLLGTGLFLLLFVILLSSRVATAQERGPGSDKPIPTGPTALTIQDLTGALTPLSLAEALAAEGVTVSNVTYSGAEEAAGTFGGGGTIIGIETGIVLGSGSVVDVVGPNVFDDLSTDHATSGDSDLDGLASFPTEDAAVLEFDFVATGDSVFFRYVFSSDEYNEYVNTQFNDVFAFYINGVNCATVGAGNEPVTINTINNGDPFGTEPNSHPELYRNNDPNDPGPPTIDTEMDGLTTVLNCGANVTPGATNHMKLAVADASDGVYDTNVFLFGLTTQPTDVSLSDLGGRSGGPIIALWIAAAVMLIVLFGLLRRRQTS